MVSSSGDSHPGVLVFFLVIIIIVVAMYFLGFFNVFFMTPGGRTIASGFSPFTAAGQTCNSTGLYLQLRNNLGTPTTFTSASITSKTGISGIGTALFSVGPSTTTLSFAGADCTVNGSAYSANIIIYYNETTSAGQQRLNTTGKVSGTAS